MQKGAICIHLQGPRSLTSHQGMESQIPGTAIQKSSKPSRTKQKNSCMGSLTSFIIPPSCNWRKSCMILFQHILIATSLLQVVQRPWRVLSKWHGNLQRKQISSFFRMPSTAEPHLPCHLQLQRFAIAKITNP